MSSIISQHKDQCHVLLAGDLNSHFGSEDLSIISSSSFGNILLHQDTNRNGDEVMMLCDILQLDVITTKHHRSTRVTWTNNSSSSQIDHVIIPKNSLYKVTKLRGFWSKVTTDHKLLTWSLSLPLNDSQKEVFNYPNYSLYYSKAWDLSALSNDARRQEYNNLIEKCLQECNESPLTWEKLSSIACYCAERLLKKKRNSMTEEQQLAYLNYRNALDVVMKQRVVDSNPNHIDPALDYPPITGPGSITLLRSAYKALQKAKNDKSRQSLKVFLDHLHDNVSSAGQKVQMAFDYLKTARRSAVQKCATTVSFKQWEEEQSKLAGNFIDLIPEADYHPMLAPPTYVEMLEIVKSMKNNKTPGFDNMSIELFKSSEVLCYKLYKFIRNAYLNNQVPLEWQQTYSIPIPKTKNPKTTSDYRRLTMCNNANKVYTALLMKKLHLYLPPMDYYQSGFIPNRSTDDLCFVLRNVLDYRWSRGRTTYLISLDMKKAFDTVLISKLPEILSSHHIPHYLINRVIAAVLTEYNSILWQGQFSHPIHKSIGIKQGCKISPELFIHILHVAVIRTKQELLSRQIALCIGREDENLCLPLFLAYADDCYVVCDKIDQGLEIVEVFIRHLSTFGLEINYHKSSILIKDPSSSVQPTQFMLNGNYLPVVDKLKVLGTHIASNMHRKNSLKPRMTSAMKLFRALLPYLESLKAPMDLLVQLFVTTIVPAMRYGLNCSSMTKANCLTLMHRETYILKMLSNIAHPRPSQTTFANLLQNKTINRRVTVARIRYYYHVKRSHRGSLIIKSLKYSENARRKIGRPIYDFNKTLSLDFRKYLEIGITKSEMDEDYELRDAIKRLTAELYKREDLQDDPLPIDLNLYTDEELQNFTSNNP